MASVRLLFVGCGSIAVHHLRAVGRSSVRAEVVGAVDPSKEAAEGFVRELTALQSCECRVFTSLSEALAWDHFTAVVLMVPHHLHEPYTEQCLRAGKHVLLEKPLSHTPESCQRLLREIEAHPHLVTMIGENSQFWPEVVKAEQLIEEGVIGEPYFAHANYWESMGGEELLDSTVRGGDHWRYNKARSGGGVLVDGATHWIRPLRIWLGEVEEVVGAVGYPYKLSQVESLAHVLLRFKNGKMATLYCHHTNIPMHPLPFFQIFGSKGEITIDGSFNGGMSVCTHASPDGEHLGNIGGYTAAFVPQMDVFLRAAANGGGLEERYGARKALGEVLLAHAVYKSLESRRWEKVSMSNLLDTQTN